MQTNMNIEVDVSQINAIQDANGISVDDAVNEYIKHYIRPQIQSKVYRSLVFESRFNKCMTCGQKVSFENRVEYKIKNEDGESYTTYRCLDCENKYGRGK
jgi:uncharacterized protein with PIN domain